MPSKRKQVNIRLSPQTELRLEQLVAALQAEWGIEVTHSDVLVAGMAELAKRYLPKGGGAAKATKRKRKGRGK
jgi:hypothetical protein